MWAGSKWIRGEAETEEWDVREKADILGEGGVKGEIGLTWVIVSSAALSGPPSEPRKT